MNDASRVGTGSSSPTEVESAATLDALGQVSGQDAELESKASRLVLTDNAVLSHEEFNKLWQSHHQRFKDSGDLSDLEKCIEYGTRALDLTPEGHPDLPHRHTNLGTSYKDRFRRLGNVNDLDKAVDHDTLALELTPKGYPAVASRHYNLGISHNSRFERLGDPKDNNKSIEHYTRALALTPEGHPSLPRRHAHLGICYASRFWHLGDLNDLQKSMEHRIYALELTPDAHPDLARRHTHLGMSYGDRFQRLGDIEDNNKSIEHYGRALALTPDGHPALGQRHSTLGIAYDDRFQRLGDLGDLERCMEHNFLALALTPDGDPNLPRIHTHLGGSYGDRFQRVGNLDDLQNSIGNYSRALILTPDGHPEMAPRLADLGVAYSGRFRRLGDLDDLQTAIKYKTRALASTPDNHSDLAYRHTELGISYGDLFLRLGDLDDLQKAIEHYSRALSLTPDQHPYISRRHNSLGVAYGNRFQRLGGLEDIEKSIEHYSRALTLTPDGHPDLPDRHANLGSSYSDRFWRLGEPEDNDNSIRCYSRALALTPDGHPYIARRHADLGAAYTDRFQRLDNMSDLQKAIEHKTRALVLTPDGHPDLADQHANLGVSYGDRFRRLGELEDSDKSIIHQSRALALTPSDHPDLAKRHAGLGVHYKDRFQRLGNLNDLEKVIEHESLALALTPAGHPDLPGRHCNRAHTFVLQYERTGDASYLNNSLDSFRTASQTPAGSPRGKFKNALRWAKHASKHNRLNCIEAYQSAIDLLPQFIWLGATTNQRYRDLSTAENLAGDAASAAIRHSNPNLALEWLEHARCVVGNQTLMLRSPLDELQSSHPDLATHLQTVSKELADAGSETSASRVPSSDSADPEQIAQRRRRLAQEYQDLLVHVRKLPGFTDFLRPLKSERLVHAARTGPVVVINCHKDRCDALLILPGTKEVQCLPLLNFIRQQAELKDTIGDVLLILWNEVVKPVLDYLGFMENDSTNDLPHITWCPTGALSFLPLHAAGDYDQPRSRIYNYAISSYTTTLTALLAPTSSSSNGTPRLLAIGQSNTPGHTPLPGITTELARIQAHTQNKAEYSELIDSQATMTAVLDTMEQYDWVHLACHAHQNVTDPTKSGFFLHDGTLDLASINRRSFKNKGLAFLSACQTGTGDEKLPNEAVHLASAMLMAGCPSVIATMWSVKDKDAPLVADKVYAVLMKECKVGNGEAGKALHIAVETLRDEVGEKEFARWVPYIHIGS